MAEISSLVQAAHGIGGNAPQWIVASVVSLGFFKWILPFKKSENDKLIKDLQDDGEHLREELRKIREASERDRIHCRKENDELHAIVRELKDEISGLRRQLTLQQVDRVVQLGGTPSDAVTEAAARVAEITYERSGR